MMVGFTMMIGFAFSVYSLAEKSEPQGFNIKDVASATNAINGFVDALNSRLK